MAGSSGSPEVEAHQLVNPSEVHSMIEYSQPAIAPGERELELVH